MSKQLIIVESPAKAKTIQKFIGKDYQVISSKGHVRDLPPKELGINIAGGYLPEYEIMPDKKKLINDIKALITDTDTILLATDDDREGEAISWHLMEAANMSEEKVKRIVFHEITKSAIDKAIDNPRKLDIDLVNAQQARRVLDRLVGFELSPVLWRKVKPQLSAGRVQSVAVKLIVEREREINSFSSVFNYKVSGQFQSLVNENTQLDADLNTKFNTKEEVLAFLQACQNAKFQISAVEKNPGKKSPAPPFTTSTLQQEAARKLGFSVSKTMVIAQQLYESGYITYMRTDSVNLSDFAMESAKEEITKLYGKEYSKTRKYVNKIKGAQEAHEAIRPSVIANHSIPGDTFAKRLYELIWKRTIASQMSDAETEKTTITIPISNRPEKFITTGEIVLFQGFLKVYIESKDEEDEEVKGWLPVVSINENLTANVITALQKYSTPPPRYTEASLVKKLEELGIGRPSTYAPTISTIQKREYVIKETRSGSERDIECYYLKNNNITDTSKKEKYGNEKDKLFPTDIGMVVNKFLQDHFETIMDYSFTAQVEKEFDDIAEGKKEWQKMIDSFYHTFHESIENAILHSTRASGERLLGQEPLTNTNIYAKLGKYGPMVQYGENYEDQKPRYARMKSTQFIDTITLEEALDLFKLPRTLGEYKGEEVTIGLGRYGAYIKYGTSYVSFPKNTEPTQITLEEAAAIIEEKKKLESERAPRLLGTYKENEVMVAIGKFGPYIKFGTQNIALDKGTNPAILTLDEAITLIDTAKTKNVLLSFDEDENLKVMNGRYGAYITNGTDNFKIPKGTQIQNLTYQECANIVANTPPTAKKRIIRKKK